MRAKKRGTNHASTNKGGRKGGSLHVGPPLAEPHRVPVGLMTCRLSAILSILYKCTQNQKKNCSLLILHTLMIINGHAMWTMYYYLSTDPVWDSEKKVILNLPEYLYEYEYFTLVVYPVKIFTVIQMSLQISLLTEVPCSYQVTSRLHKGKVETAAKRGGSVCSYDVCVTNRDERAGGRGPTPLKQNINNKNKAPWSVMIIRWLRWQPWDFPWTLAGQ